MAKAEHEKNTALARQIVDGVMQELRQKYRAEQSANDFNFEVYYPIKNPYAAGTPEHGYYSQLIEHGTGQDPNYVDLFEQIITLVKQEALAEGIRTFTMLNCRFDATKEDNFLLYILAS